MSLPRFADGHVEHPTVGKVRQADLGQGFGRPLIGPGLGLAHRAQAGGREGCDVPGEAALLGQVAGAPRQGLGRKPAHRLAAQPRLPAGDRLQAEGGTDQRGLAGAVRPDDAHDFAGLRA